MTNPNRMHRSWLVQRLLVPRPPREGKPHPLDKAHRAFGGGMLGLTKEMWDFVDPVFEIDYMGAAEYEMGMFPRALLEMTRRELAASRFTVERKDVDPNDWGRKLGPPKKKRKKGEPAQSPVPTGSVAVYTLCEAQHSDEVEKRVRAIIGGKYDLRDPSMMNHALDPLTPADHRYAGWFELDNGFFFFIDEGMWRSVCEWFGIEPAQAQSA